MTAEEARALATKNRTERVGVVISKIKCTAQAGFTKMYWYDHLTFEERQVLTDLGYRVGKEHWDLKTQTRFSLIEW